jgi:hypothetical protein
MDPCTTAGTSTAHGTVGALQRELAMLSWRLQHDTTLDRTRYLDEAADVYERAFRERVWAQRMPEGAAGAAP